MQTNKQHIQAEKFRESEQFEEALKNYDQAIKEYRHENNFEGQAEALLGKFLTYKHLYLTTTDQLHLIKAIICIQKSLEIIDTHNLSNAYRAYFSLGEAKILQGDYTDAVESYRKAIELISQNSAEKGNYMYHLGEALYLDGKKKEGEKELLRGLEEIQKYKDTTDTYLYNVWLSGCHLKIASLLRNDQPEIAQNHLNSAEKLIESDSRLLIRKKQLSTLRKLST